MGAPTAVLNPDILERIRRVGGPELVERLLDLFLTQAPDRFRRLTEAIRRDDWTAVEAHAHSLKSSSGNVGAETLRRTLNEIESAAEERLGDAVRAAQASLESRFEEFMRALRRLRAV